MHHGWQIYDILRLILELLEPEDLTQLAQTCQFLYEPCVEESRKYMSLTTQLYSLLPKDCRYRPIRVEDLGALDLYASKVESITFGTEGYRHPATLPKEFLGSHTRGAKDNKEQRKARKLRPGKSWVDLWAEIATVRPASAFFPKLRILDVQCANEDLLEPLIGISGLNLEHIHIGYLHRNRHLNSVRRFLESLRQTPKLRYLSVRKGHDELPASLVKQSRLDTLRIDGPVVKQVKPKYSEQPDYSTETKDVLSEIFQQKTLKHLSLGLSQWFPLELGSDFDGKYFPKLESLNLNLEKLDPHHCGRVCPGIEPGSWTCRNSMPRASSLSDVGVTRCQRVPIITLLRGLHGPELRSLHITFPQTMGPEKFIEIIQAIRNSSRLEKLETLALISGHPECRRRSGYHLTRRDLRNAITTLLPLPLLKTLNIPIVPDLVDILDRDDFERMGEGMPALETLVMADEECSCSTEVPHLAAFCSRFVHLRKVIVGGVRVNRASLARPVESQHICPQLQELTMLCLLDYHHLEAKKTGPHIEEVTGYFPNSDMAKEMQRWIDPSTELKDNQKLCETRTALDDSVFEQGSKLLGGCKEWARERSLERYRAANRQYYN